MILMENLFKLFHSHWPFVQHSLTLMYWCWSALEWYTNFVVLFFLKLFTIEYVPLPAVWFAHFIVLEEIYLPRGGFLMRLLYMFAVMWCKDLWRCFCWLVLVNVINSSGMWRLLYFAPCKCVWLRWAEGVNI